MKVPFRINLGTRIILWFLLNLLVLGVAAALVVGWQFRFGIDFLFKGRAGERIDALGRVISSELRASPPADWNEVLERHSKAYGVRFLLFNRDGRQLAGPATQLPRDVASRLRERMPPLPREEFIENPDRRMEEDRRGRKRRAGPPPGARPPRFALRTTAPTLYWVGVVFDGGADELPGMERASLLIVSETLGGGGLFFDWRPAAVVGSCALALSVVFWLPLIMGITRALRVTTEATGRIAEGRFDARLDIQRGDELGALGHAVNQMASRLEAHVTGQKRFLGDVAHELCAPIARMQMALGILEQRADEKQRAYVGDVREELQHMSQLVNELLSFSKASIGAGSVELQPVELSGLVAEVVRREGVGLAELAVDVPVGLKARADAQMLSRALANILRNAARYAGGAGPIRIAAREKEGWVLISVTDSGSGVPAGDLENIFEPFFRMDTARTRETGGVGLGLAIVRTCVQGCGGTVTARNLQPRGFEVVIQVEIA